LVIAGSARKTERSYAKPADATEPKIRSFGATPIMASVLAVDESELNEPGFYHPLE
jgi:hypothetical protein